jgi:hypothetical protein
MHNNRLMFAMLATLAAILLAPTNASAYAVTADPAALYVNETGNVVFTVSGAATDITAFTVGVTPDSAFPGYLDAETFLINNANTSGAAVDSFIDADSTVDPPVFVGLFSQTIVDPFSIAEGPIFDIIFTGLTPKAPGFSTVSFGICALRDFGDECVPATFQVRIAFVERPGGNAVPEPATLWLAAAALIAGGLIFRKDTKSS